MECRTTGILSRILACVALAGCIAGLLTKPPRPSGQAANSRHDSVTVSIDLASGHPVSQTLFGIFFEEINHAGEGGLYAELVQDRSFDALALTQRFDADSNSSNELELSNNAFVAPDYGGRLPPMSAPSKRLPDVKLAALRTAQSTATVPVTWTPIGDATRLSLTTNSPLGPTNPVALQIVAPYDAERSGIANSGYWGISVRCNSSYHVSLYLKYLDGYNSTVTVALESANGSATYGSMQVSQFANHWQRYEGTIEVGDIADDHSGRLAITFGGGGTLLVDVVSVFPLENVPRGGQNPWPFRADLLQMLKDLRPRFIRFPGGCYVEGDVLADSFYWKRSIGPYAERRGHWNLWGYWSTDGLGLFEYMQLAEELGAQAVWVINNGVSHTESIATGDLQPMIQDALDAVEFVIGPVTSKWGAYRAQMGHPEPFELKYFAIGNEDCGRPYYLQNYIAFFEALHEKYPHLRLIANCDLKHSAPMDMFDWHIYTDPATMFKLQTAFDLLEPDRNPHVFASEYAVTAGGGHGNLIAAIAEAAFMTGLERNSEVVEMAAYAPLFVHTKSINWPTNLIMIDNHRAYGIVSYHVQQLFSRYQGTRYVDTAVVSEKPLVLSAASATCATDACEQLAVKVINMGLLPRNVTVAFSGLANNSTVAADGEVTVLTGPGPLVENTFEQPLKVAPRTFSASHLGQTFRLHAPPLSLSIVVVHLQNGSAAISGGSLAAVS